MIANRDEILDAALIPEDDRVLIAGRLLETVPEELNLLDFDDPELEAELGRRSGDWEGAVPWERLREESQGQA